jgi:uncharacterized protein
MDDNVAQPVGTSLVSGEKWRGLVFFFLLAFLFSWACKVPGAFVPGWPGVISFLSLLSPAFAALVVLSVSGEKARVNVLLRALFKWHVSIFWYFAALLVPAVLVGGLLLANRLLWPGENSSLSGNLLPGVLLALVNFLYMMLITWGEELGWRGYALPRLQARMHPLAASAVLGALWALWHLPNFWIPGSPQRLFPIPIYLLYVFGHTFLYSWIYNGSRGSLLLVCIHHAATNALLAAMMAFPGFSGAISHPIALILVVGAADVLVIALTKGRLFVERSVLLRRPGNGC